MEQTRLMEIITAAQKGRAISPAYVEKVVDNYLQKPLADHLPDGLDEDSRREYQRELNKIIGADYANEPWGIFAKEYHRRNYKELTKEVEEFSYISMPGSVAHNLVPFYRLAVSDYLHYAGLDAEYAKWFKNDCDVWEEGHCGISPSIGDVLYCIGDFLDSSGFMIIHYREDYTLGGTFREEITEPFVRKTGTDVEEHHYNFLAVVWTWMLMIEAPFRIMEKKGA